MIFLNTSNSTSLIINENVDCIGLASSYYVFTITRKINIFLSIFIIIIGLIGNFIQAAVFLHKKFRINSSNVYLLILALSDGLFLIIHFFEDTLRTYQVRFKLKIYLMTVIFHNCTLGCLFKHWKNSIPS